MLEKSIHLDEKALGKILDVTVMGVKYLVKEHPTTEFMVEVSKVSGTSIAIVKKKVLNW